MSRTRNQTAGDAGVAFVVGAGRSGTTLLYKLLCLHPGVAYVSGLEQRLRWLPLTVSGRLRPRRCRMKLRAWFRDGNAYYTGRRLSDRLVPAPSEAPDLYRRCGLADFPERTERLEPAVAARLQTTLQTLRTVGGASMILCKRTANNRRIEALHEVFPGARFVHLVRDGREVADSLFRVSWWRDHPLWWDHSHRTPAEAVADGEDMLSLCARNWVAETERIAIGLAAVPAPQVCTVHFETLLAEPVPQLRRLCRFLGLPWDDELETALRSLGLGSRAARWRSVWSPRQIELVSELQRGPLARLGYA